MTEAVVYVGASVDTEGGGKQKRLTGSVNVSGAPYIKVYDADGNILLSNDPLNLGLCQLAQGKEYLTLYVENRNVHPLYNAVITAVSANGLQIGSAENTYQSVGFASEGNNMNNGVIDAWIARCGIGEGADMQKGGVIRGFGKYQVAMIYYPPESAGSGEVFFAIRVSGNYVFSSQDAQSIEASVYVVANNKQTLEGSVDVIEYVE